MSIKMYDNDKHKIHNDDELKKWFEDEIIDNSIDFNTPEFKKNPKYIESKDKCFRFSYNVILSFENIVKRCCISDEKVYKNVYGPYALGYKGADESAETYSLDKLYDYITSNDKKDVTINGNINKYFERNKSGNSESENDGLIRKLYNWGIDIDKYDNVSQCKLLYYIYTIEKGKKEIRVFSMLKKPTLENVADPITNTHNGDLMLKMKQDISLEIPFSDILNNNYILIFILHEMEKRIQSALSLLKYQNIDIKSLAKRIKQLSLPKSYTHPSVRPKNLFELFYLKLIQHENHGRENDITDLTDFACIELPSKEFPKNDLNALIPKQEVKSYLNDNRATLSKIVLDKTSISSNDYRTYDCAVENVNKIIDTLELNTFADFDECGVHEKLLIVILQACIFTCKNLNVDNHFYGYTSSDIKNVRKEMSQGVNALCKNQLAISKLIWDTYYQRCGKKPLRDIIYRYEKRIDNIIQRILSGNSLEEMMYMYLDIICDLDYVLLNDQEIQSSIEIMNLLLIDEYQFVKNDVLLKKYIPLFLKNPEIVYSIINDVNFCIRTKREMSFSVTKRVNLIDLGLPVEYILEAAFKLNIAKNQVHLCKYNIKEVYVY